MKIWINLDSMRTVKGETADCGVTSLAIAGGVSYREAWDILNKWGRDKGEGVNTLQLEYAAQTINPKAKRFSAVSKVTLGQFIKIHSKGKFIAYTKNHAMAVVDGRLYDANMTRLNSKIEGFILL